MALRESYKESIEKEKAIYENCANVHNLPEIFHYWSNRYIVPKFAPFGFRSADEMFPLFLAERCAIGTPQRFISLGAGNCDLEIGFAKNLAARGYDNFVIDCLELNPAMIERGRTAARESKIENRINFIEGDFNSWNPTTEYDAAIASQALHHVVNLEGLFDEVKRSLRPGGSFVIHDMIGRNGHMRWPEGLDIIHDFWRQLPPSYRFNRSLQRYEELYENWDCSGEGFEGIRAQDILPLLIERFHFHLFIPFGSIIDPFIDRPFGHSFNAEAEWDRSFIDRIQQRDDEELSSGRLTPTHMVAVLRNEPAPAPLAISPASCVRDPNKGYQSATPPASNYAWNSWPHDPQRELEIVTERLAKMERELRTGLHDRTVWALDLLAERDAARARAETLAAAQPVSPFRRAARALKEHLS